MERKTRIASLAAAGLVAAGTRLRINHPDGIQLVVCEDGLFRNAVPGPAEVSIDKNSKGKVTDIRQ